MIRSTITFAAIVALSGASSLFSEAQVCWSHPFHFTTTEMEFNPRTGRFEVSVRVLASDLEQALAHTPRARTLREHGNVKTENEIPINDSLTNHQATKNRVLSSHVLKSETFPGESSPSAEQVLINYVEQNFKIQAKQNVRAADPNEPAPKAIDSTRIHWVGKELEQSWVWLYFEIDAPTSSTHWQLTNQLFIEINEQQINTCLIRAGAQRLSVKTEAKNCTVDLPLIFRK